MVDEGLHMVCAEPPAAVAVEAEAIDGECGDTRDLGSRMLFEYGM